MDPISIVGFAAASARIAAQVGTTLYQFHQASKDVDQTFENLAAEVEGVAQSLNSLQRTLRSPTIANIHNKIYRKSDVELWQSVEATVTACRQTLIRLQQEVIDSRPPGPTVVQNWIRQFKLNCRTDDINYLRNQLQTHRASIHTSLLMMDLHATSLTSGLMLDELLPRISKLQVSMDTLNERQKVSADYPQDDLSNLPMLENQAKRVLSSALTIASAEELSTRSNASEKEMTTGSELGEPLEPGQVHRIETWASSAPTLLQNSRSISPLRSPYLDSKNSIAHTMRNTLTPSDVLEDSDDDADDFLLDHVRTYLREGDLRLEAKEYHDAEDCYMRALEKSKKLHGNQLAKVDISNVQLTLAIISCELQDFESAESRLVPIADPSAPLTTRTTAGYKDAQRRFHACHLLAQIYLGRDDLMLAEEYGVRALRGRHKMRTVEPETYYQSARLMSIIAEKKGDEREARLYLSMVPEPEPEPEQQEPEIEPEQDSFLRPGVIDDDPTPSPNESVIILPSPPVREPRDLDEMTVRPPRTQTMMTTSTSSEHSTGGMAMPPASEDPLTLNTLIHNGYDPNSRAFDPDAALYWAAKSGELRILRQLIRGFAISFGQKRNKTKLIKAKNLDYISADGLTPLMAAATRNHVGVISILASAKARVNFKTKTEKRTALHVAALRGHQEAVRALLDDGADIESVDHVGNTPLHLCCTRNDTDMIATLIAAGASKEAKTLQGTTPLRIAVLSRQEEVVGTLLHHGAHVDTALFRADTSPHATPSAVSAQSYDTEYGGPAIPALQQPTALHLAATTGDTQSLSLLLLPAFKANIEIRTADGRTPLHCAAIAGQLPAMSMLLDHGANLEGKDVHGRTALSFVAGMGAITITTPTSPNSSRPASYIRRTVSNSSSNILETPLSSSPPSTTTYNNYNNNTVNSSSASNTSQSSQSSSHLPILVALLRAGASPHTRESDGCTPLHIAAFEGDIAAVRLLIQHGADATLKRKGDLTARDLAKRMGYKELAAILQDAEKGRGEFKKDKDGNMKGQQGGGGGEKGGDAANGGGGKGRKREKWLGLGIGRNPLTA